MTTTTISKNMRKKVIEMSLLKEEDKMSITTKKTLKKILDKEYSYGRNIEWTFFNGVLDVQLYFDIEEDLELDFINRVNDFLKNNGWKINEICHNEFSYFFTLKKYVKNGD